MLIDLSIRCMKDGGANLPLRVLLMSLEPLKLRTRRMLVDDAMESRCEKRGQTTQTWVNTSRQHGKHGNGDRETSNYTHFY